MPITAYGNDEITISRARILEFLREQKRRDPGYRVLDVGGASKPWAAAYTDAYVDIKPFQTDKPVFLGNICEPEVWERVVESGPPFDFSICTHVLEDVRDPMFVAKWLMRVSRAGFIAMPNKHFEFVNNESRFYTGCSHHRWIYTIQRDGACRGEGPAADTATVADEPWLLSIAKLPVVQGWQSPLAPLFRVVTGIPVAGSFLAAVLRWLRFQPALPRLPWLEPRLGRGDMELNFRWEGAFDFRMANNDYNGPSTAALAARYAAALDGGV